MNEDFNNKEPLTTDQVGKKMPVKISLLSILLTILGICIIGGGFFLWWQNKENNQIVAENSVNTSSSSTSILTSSTSSVSSSSASSVDLTTDWRTYSSNEFGLNFKYPSDWVVSRAPDDGYQSGVKIDDIIVTSPTNFQISFKYVTGMGGICGPDGCPVVEILKSEKLEVNSTTSLYLIELSGNLTKVQTTGGVICLSDTASALGQEANMYCGTVFETPGSNHGGVLLEGQYASGSTQQSLSAVDYFNLPDVKTGEQIFKTVKF